ncbi:hypothetical protein, partial [Streptomyces althioticus]|uniref:hypothetical protein n=1 Tax=Streptomyces althioticus TaxID=83380 RepID=UPI0033D14CC6
VDKVVLTAPGKGDVPNIVHGVNHDTLKPAGAGCHQGPVPGYPTETQSVTAGPIGPDQGGEDAPHVP